MSMPMSFWDAVASLCISAYNAGLGRAERMVALLLDGLRYVASRPAVG